MTSLPSGRTSVGAAPANGSDSGGGSARGGRRGRRRLPTHTGATRRRGELVLGILLVAGCGLGALVAATDGRSETPVLALAEPITRGEVVEDADLKVTYLRADSAVAHVDEVDREDLIGLAALADLGAGTIVTAEQFGEPAVVTAPGEGTVGLALEPGQLPVLPIAVGDQVEVVGGASGEGGSGGALQGVLANAEVVATDKLDDSSGSWWVSLRAAGGDARTLASAVAGGARLQLVLVGR